MGQGVTLIDSGVETLNEVSMLLDYFGLSRSAKDAQIQPPCQQFYTTGDAKQFAQFVTAWLEQAEPSIGQCQIEGDEILEVSHRNAE